MAKPLILLFLAVLSGCAATPTPQYTASPCYASETSYDCQVERYHNVNVN